MLELSKSRTGSADGSLLRIRLLGKMDTETDHGVNLLPIGSKTRALLAVLALSARKPVHRKTIADLLWSGVGHGSALASLRQEVHRLRKTFEPAGIEPIEVQRHTLALKPVYTCVDVEKILHGGVEVLTQLTAPEIRLLPEMTAVDPAFDKWLSAQRDHLDRHILALFKQALQQGKDPETVLIHAEGLLRRDALNELAWRSRLRAFIDKGEWGEAARGCAELLKLYDEKLGVRPGPETMQLVRDIQTRFAIKPEMHDPRAQTVSSGTSYAAAGPSTEHVGPGLGTGLGLDSRAPQRVDRTRVLGRIVVESFSAPPGVQLGPSVSALAEQLEVELARLDTIQVVVRPPQAAASVHQTHSQPHLHSQSRHDHVDFRVEGFVCADSTLSSHDHDRAETRITVRLISCRDDDYLIWADRIRFPISQDAIRAFNRYVLWALQWSLLLWEGTSCLNRATTDLSPARLAARSVHLMTACDSTRWPEMLNLIKNAEVQDADHVIVLFVKAQFALLGFLTCWYPFSGSERRDLARQLERVGAKMRHNPLGEHLILFARLILPSDFDQVRALQSSDISALNDYALPTLHCFYAWHALLHGDVARARDHILKFEQQKTALAIMVIMEPISAIMLHGCGEHDKAHRIVSAYLYIYPRCKLGLLVYLLGLLHLEAYEEASDAHERILRLAPDTTITGVAARLSYLPEQIQEWSTRMLLRSSLPR